MTDRIRVDRAAHGILIVDDEFSVRDSLCSWFKKDGYRVIAAESATAALAVVQTAAFDVVLLDIRMPGMDGLQLQRELQKLAPDSVVIMMTAYAAVDSAVMALKQGAFDYVTKPVDPDDLGRIVDRALQQRRLRSGASTSKAPVPVVTSEVVGRSEAMQRVFRLVDSLAETDVTVVIRGDSGTGKEVVARTIHTRSPRRTSPLVSVNCGALPESLLESELFGHEKGAFTGAHKQRKGKLEQADGGTLFLDEIGTISPRTQVELLRVLDTKEFTRIGGGETVRSDFRVICATNQDLERMVADKTFREDLYFRINVFRIDLPPLRERDGDVPLLALHFLALFSAKMKKGIERFSPEALVRLSAHDWPGNVRELANTVERAVVIGHAPSVEVGDLWFGPDLKVAESEDGGGSLAEMEKAHIARVLHRTGWNMSRAARLLEVDRATLYNKTKKYGLHR